MMRLHLMMNGGERLPASGHKGGWIIDVMMEILAEELRGVVLLFRDLRILQADSRVGTTGESTADLRGGAVQSPPKLHSCSCKS